jgi:hypothetical protein
LRKHQKRAGFFPNSALFYWDVRSAGSTKLSAPMTHLDTQSPHPLHRSVSCSTDFFFHAVVSNEKSRNLHAETHLPQPE